jgi:hypothetical protein
MGEWKRMGRLAQGEVYAGIAELGLRRSVWKLGGMQLAFPK